jgi:hypothetical protein
LTVNNFLNQSLNYHPLPQVTSPAGGAPPLPIMGSGLQSRGDSPDARSAAGVEVKTPAWSTTPHKDFPPGIPKGKLSNWVKGFMKDQGVT